MALAVEREATPAQEILELDRAVIRQTELPERHLVGAFLPVARIEVDEDENAVVLVPRHARIGEYLVVPRMGERDVSEVPQGGVLAPDLVEPPEVVGDVARPVVVPCFQLVLLGIE